MQMARLASVSIRDPGFLIDSVSDLQPELPWMTITDLSFVDHSPSRPDKIFDYSHTTCLGPQRDEVRRLKNWKNMK